MLFREAGVKGGLEWGAEWTGILEFKWRGLQRIDWGFSGLQTEVQLPKCTSLYTEREWG